MQNALVILQLVILHTGSKFIICRKSAIVFMPKSSVFNFVCVGGGGGGEVINSEIVTTPLCLVAQCWIWA